MANDAFFDMTNLIHTHYIQDDELFNINYVHELLDAAYKKFNITVLSNHIIDNMEYEFKIIFTVNNLTWNIKYVCKGYHNDIYGEDLLEIINQIENRIKSSENRDVKGIITKAEDWKPMICTRCGGSIKRNKCEYCGTEFIGNFEITF